MKVVKGREQVGVYDESCREIRIRNRTYEVPPNLIISTGDTVTVKGDRYDVLDYNPSWFAVVARRGAQIIHSKDAAYIISRAGISHGDTVLEAGVGSGALSSALLWAVGKNGKLFSVESDRSAIERARENVSNFQVIEDWEIIQGDVRTDLLPTDLDCIILDIPDPWDAVGNSIRSLKTGGHLVTYSPTFNQTERNVAEMEAAGMSVVETVEITKRNILVRPDATRPDHQMIGHTAFITFGVKKSGHSVEL